jgi:hypothetical protein
MQAIDVDSFYSWRTYPTNMKAPASTAHHGTGANIKLHCLAVIVTLVAFGSPLVTAQPSRSTRQPDAAEAVGVYTGSFGRNNIVLRLESISGETVTGYSEVGKNRRAFRGSVAIRNGVAKFQAQEPGDNPEDGVFRFEYLPEEQALPGTWTPNNKNLADITFTITKRGSAGTRPAPTASEKQDASASSGYVDGTIVRFDPPPGMEGQQVLGNANSIVIKDANGREHSFPMYRGDQSVLAYASSFDHIGSRVRVHWDLETEPKTGKKVRFASEISDFGGGLYHAPKGSSEWNAVVEAVRADDERREKKRRTITAGGVRIENGWAGFSGAVKAANEKGRGEDLIVILRRSGSKWTVVGGTMGPSFQRPGPHEVVPGVAETQRIRREYPDAPGSVMKMLDFP